MLVEVDGLPCPRCLVQLTSQLLGAADHVGRIGSQTVGTPSVESAIKPWVEVKVITCYQVANASAYAPTLTAQDASDSEVSRAVVTGVTGSHSCSELSP